jgi:ABC-2 type transport system ATP-binding protein
MPPVNAIEAEGLRKRYGDTEALNGVDLAVPAGSVCGLLGPNGAGKTTAVRILTTLSNPDEGSARVAGFDVKSEPMEVRRRIGLAAQDATVDGLLSGFENLQLIGELQHLPRRTAKLRAEELLEQFNLRDARDKLVRDYSGGMRRRLDLGATLVARPEVLFLDEPTTGLDPRARNELWEVLETLVGAGTTILLTTQYLEEADRLADEIVVVDHGRVIARGDSGQLKRQVGGEQILLVPSNAVDVPRAVEILERVCAATASVDEATRHVTVPTDDGVAAVGAVVEEIRSRSIAVDDLGLHQPTLDDVFLTLTGSAPAGGGEADPAEVETREPEAAAR